MQINRLPRRGITTTLARHGKQVYHASSHYGRVFAHGLISPTDTLYVPSGTRLYDDTKWTLNVAYTACVDDLSGVEPTRLPGLWVDRGGQMRQMGKSYISPLHSRRNFGTSQNLESLALLGYPLLINGLAQIQSYLSVWFG